MENDALFSNIPENAMRKKQHLHKIETQADSKLIIITVIVRTKALSVEQLTMSQCEQDSKECLRTPKKFKDDCLLSATPGFYTFSDRMLRHIESSSTFCISLFLMEISRKF
ncbi:hypothetical protein AVEN_66827-1 [Araneus ventricosus]|uniref:Uncharacterized protein n=1 Tax=Araneus ventricosus TaxID=182803 RepID=A0A4Y2DRM9_ARAVE|nr:hypothetical protein AVEN_66827-1 [Araneus ventricosus]